MNYIPLIHCAKCNKDVPYGVDVMRVSSSDGIERYIRVRCHGEEQRVNFTDKSGEKVVLWQDHQPSAGTAL